MSPQLVLLRHPALSPAADADAASEHSLRSDELLREVELLMARLAGGDRLERTGVMVQEHLSTGGKRIRARLALSAAAALGAPRARAIGWAAACELLHNATLIHDDIQDGDLIRRGQPTTWVRHGVPQAINAGDLLLMLPFLAVTCDLALEPAVQAGLSRGLAEHAARTVRGQSEEMDLLGGAHLDRVPYLRAVRGKTGGLFALPVEGAALIAGFDEAEARLLGETFTELGVLFQLQDDVLDLYGDKGRGLPGSDLKEGKVSALVVAHLERVPEDRAWLLNLLRAPRDLTPQREVEEAIRRFRASGALHDVLDEIHAITERVRLDPHLAELPALHSLALELATAAVAPIRHLWGQR